MLTKQERAQIIIPMVLAMDERYGFTIPAPGTAATRTARLIQPEPKWRARVTPEQRITIAFHSRREVGERRLPAADCRLFELEVQDRAVLVANLRGDEIHLHAYRPGRWESWFGIDSDDTVALDPGVFADPKDPRWQALLASADCQLPPLRDGTRDEEEQSSRRRSSPRKRLG